MNCIFLIITTNKMCVNLMWGGVKFEILYIKENNQNKIRGQISEYSK